MNEPEIPQAPDSDIPPYVWEPVPQTFIEQRGISPFWFGVIVLVFIFILYQFVGSLFTILIFGFDIKNANANGLRLATGIGQILLILFPTLYLVKFASFTPKSFLRVNRPNFLACLLAIVGIFSLQQILQVYLFFQEKIPLPKPIYDIKQNFEQLFQEAYKTLVLAHSPGELLFVIFIVAFIPAIAEEFLFRGLVQRSFEKGLTPTLGFILTGIIFGAYHLNPFTFIPLAALGIYLGYIAMRADSIWVSSIGHFFNNALACIAVYLNIDDEAVLTGDPEKLSVSEVLILFAVMATVFTISTYLFWYVTKPREEEQSSTMTGSM